MLNTKDNLIGEWFIKVFTPFGETNAQATISSTEPFIIGTIVGEKGSVDFADGILKDGSLKLSAKVETPIKASITAEVKIDGFSFSGFLMIDEYMKVKIVGEKNVNI